MLSYVVRVYRRNPDNKDDVAGIIEKIGTRHQYAFRDLSELQESLAHLIKSEESDYSEARQIDMYGYDRMSLNG